MKVKNKMFVIFLLIVYITGSISGVYFISEYSLEFQKYEEYYNPVITGIGFILGLIVVVTIFYLGKSHDYYKSMLEISNKNNIDFDSYNDSFNIAEKEFKKFSETSEKIFKSIKEHDREDIEKFEELYEKVKKYREQRLVNFKKIEKILEREEEIKINLSKHSKTVIIKFLMYAILFAISFLLSTLFLEDPTVGKFYFLIIHMILSIISFFLYWFSSNEKINGILENYDILLSFSRLMNNAELQEKNHIPIYEEWKTSFPKLMKNLTEKNQM